MIVKPAAGLRVLDPHTRRELAPDTAHNLPDNEYWMRLLRDGDVIAVEPAEHGSVEPAEPAAS